jgi:hypothetical protein
MTVGACAVWFVHAQRGEKRITAEAITAPALPAADLAFLIGLLLVPYVPYTSDTPTHRVVAVTTVLSVLALMLRHMSFTRAFTGIPYLPDHTLFAAISLSDSWQKGKELSRKMGIPIPGLADDEPFRQVVETDMGFLQRVYLLHFFRLAVTTLAWDAALTHMSITDVVAHHPWLALIGGLALYRAPTFLAGLRQSPLSVTAPAVIAIDVLRGVMLASAGGVVRSLINIFGFGVSDSEKDHVVTHAHLIVSYDFNLFTTRTWKLTSPTGPARYLRAPRRTRRPPTHVLHLVPTRPLSPRRSHRLSPGWQRNNVHGTTPQPRVLPLRPPAIQLHARCACHHLVRRPLCCPRCWGYRRRIRMFPRGVARQLGW